MVRAYSISDSPEEGFSMYRDLLRRGLRADALASSFVIKSCIRVSSLLGGIQVHARILRDGHESDSRLLTTLMDLYSICGKCDEACKLFDEMPKRDVVAWNVLISCCLHNNRTRDAVSLFDIMQSETHRCEPDDVTCLLMLQACSNLNALEFGERVHKIHGHDALAESVIGHLIELKAQEAGDYVLLMNIYSSAGNWEKLTEVRKFMKEKAIQTTPGCSTIELKGVAHEFVVDDVSHPRRMKSTRCWMRLIAS
ncbi:pentatricopeptide repeat-containing protein [Prunus yedoensis var. nudiflora]|uniref:Pentatricopeptide repeat-containing protein n=1 Tax=Prunus yedoensis var. nudiflora TaxID=2094558 RepID=A0A314XP76_PRUYE|nr:pentatricopeptide repeat-containing protein [Prunus yedoensis var. nudiflora]